MITFSRGPLTGVRMVILPIQATKTFSFKPVLKLGPKPKSYVKKIVPFFVPMGR